MSFICIIVKNHFHINGFALSLALKVRFFGTRKWPIASPKITANIFLSFPWHGTIWFSKRNCWFAHVNGKQNSFRWKRIVQLRTSILNLLASWSLCFVLIRSLGSEVKPTVALSFSLLMQSRKMHAPKILPNWAKRYTRNCVHISNIKETFIQ